MTAAELRALRAAESGELHLDDDGTRTGPGGEDMTDTVHALEAAGHIDIAGCGCISIRSVEAGRALGWECEPC